MPRKTTKGTRQIGLELSEPLVAELRQFAKRGEYVRDVVEQALRRHFDNPPPRPSLPPLPPVTFLPKRNGNGRKKK
jgi:hypothetical protein